MRYPDQHLSADELESLGREEGLSDGLREDLGAAREHVQSCPSCRRRLEVYPTTAAKLEKLRAPKKAPKGPDCPSVEVWLNVAGGLLSTTEKERYVTHAATCDHCGPVLREIVHDFDKPVTAEEKAVLAELNSPSNIPAPKPATHNKLVTQVVPSRIVPPSRRWFALPAWQFATIAVVILAAVGFSLYRVGIFRKENSSASVNRLLAQAYTEQRTIEPRIAGANYAPLSVKRGLGESNVNKPPVLLRAEAEISENLRKSPSDPTWLQAKGRADLLDGKYGDAIKSLRLALLSKPDSPELLTDLGSAYFEVEDYGNALESFAKALARSPNDPVVIFDHALACEKLFLYNQAIEDWQHYLQIDPKGGWADEAQANSKRIKDKMAERQARVAAPLLSPMELVALIDTNQERALDVLDQRAEQYLENAIQSWLPQLYTYNTSRRSVIEVQRSLTYLAEILKDHHDDMWLADFLQTLPSPNAERAVLSMAASDEALKGGHYGLSIELARKSAREFERTGNQAGMLRASFALMFAQSFAFKTDDCLKTAAAIIPLLSTTRYRWLQIQTLIQQGLCQYVEPQVDDALKSTAEGTRLAKLFHYPGLELRAIAFAAGCRRDTGSADRGLRELINGLSTFWQIDAVNTRGENLYTVLFNIAVSRNWHHLEALALGEKINDFPVKDPVDQAVGWELLAGADERAGDDKAAQIALQRSMAQLATLPEDSGIVLRKAEIKLEDAGIELRLGDPEGALTILAPLQQQFEAGDGLSRAEYFKTCGEAYLAIGLTASAEPLFERALSIVEKGLRGLSAEVDKLQWSRTQGQLYRDLLEIKLRSASPAEAFALWEWFKSASLRAPTIMKSGVLSNVADPALRLPPLSSYKLSPNTALVSYVLSKNSLTAFVFRDGMVQRHALQIPNDTELQILRFLSLCAEPSTDIDSFNVEGRHLYDVLIAPLASEIQGATRIRFETDGILDRVPLGLLRDQNGNYLGDRFDLTYSLGLAYGSYSATEILSPSSHALVVVAPEVQELSFESLSEFLEEGQDVAAFFTNSKTLSGSSAIRETVLRSLREAEIFHFVGHGIADVEHVGLVLGPGALLSSNDFVNLRPKKLRLAVLSACETANGDGDSFSDINSIARTLAATGVPHIIASRWRVDATATGLLMHAFYSSLMAGKDPAESLREASAKLRSLPQYQHPYYWASFSIFGS